MKIFIQTLCVVFLLSSCKEESNPVKYDPPNPYAQKEIEWPSLQKAPWPMFRHDPQLTGRSQYRGPSKGILIDTINGYFLSSGISIDQNDRIYFPRENSSAHNFFSVYATNKALHWSIRIPMTHDNINMPTIASNGNIIVQSQSLTSVSSMGEIQWQISPANNDFFLAYNTILDKAGNMYLVERQSKTLRCYSPQGELQWSFSDSRIKEEGHQMSISPDGRTLYIQCYPATSLLALDILTKTVRWSFGSTALYTPPVIDNQGNIYFLKSTTAVPIDTFFCLTPDGDVRWQYIYHKGNSIPNLYWGSEPITIDHDGNVYLIAPRDTLVSLSNDGLLRWKFPLNELNGSAYQLVCDASGTVYFATISNHVLAVTKFGTLLWSLKLPFDETYNSPSLSEGKLFLTGYGGKIYIIE